MSLIKTLTRGLIHIDGEEWPGGSFWQYGNYWVSTKIVTLLLYIRLLPIFILSLFGVKWAKKIMGHALGYGSCSHCGMTWNYVGGKSIYYTESGGVFPVCEECFHKLPPEEIDLYIDRLISEWLKFGWHEDITPEELAKSAKAEGGVNDRPIEQYYPLVKV